MVVELIGIFTAIITLGIVSVIFGSPRTSSIVNAWFQGFASSLRAAESAAA